jgi:hypothetical protein
MPDAFSDGVNELLCAIAGDQYPRNSIGSASPQRLSNAWRSGYRGDCDGEADLWLSEIVKIHGITTLTGT